MTRTAILPILIGGIATAIAGQPATAQVGKFGSAQLSTQRTCLGERDAYCTATADPNDPQNNTSPILQQVYGGGVGQFGSAKLNIDREGTDNDAYARSTVSQGMFLLPQISAETLAGKDDRMNINAFGFQSYTWAGDTPKAFSLAGNLHIVDSGKQEGYPTTIRAGGLFAGGAMYDAYVAVWDPSILGSFTTAEDLIANLLQAPCGRAGVLGVGRQTSVTLRGGEFSTSVATSECSAGSLTLQPGQEILAVSGLRLPTNRGGFVDATHTFTTVFDPALPQETRDALANNLVAATQIPAVPEPTTWAMMIAGFAMVGAAMRRRYAVRVVTA